MVSPSTDRLRWHRAAAARFGAFRERVRAVPGGALAWRLGVTVTGVAIVAIGIVLLPLPGPGWLIIFSGLGVLATEYPWAARLLSWTRAMVARWTRWFTLRGTPVRVALGLIAGLFLLAVLVACWWLVRTV